KFSLTTQLVLITLAIAWTRSVHAIPVTVEQIGISPAQLVSVNVTGAYKGKSRAGVSQLLVNGIRSDGFCIDPFHQSIHGLQAYDMVSLIDAPKDDHLIPGTHMTATE